MTPPRTIVHLDADAFFAAEQASDAHLRGKPVAAGGEKRGIIASASYEARKFGVYTPMPTVRARKLCPKLILEGTRLTHKTDIAFALNEHPPVVGPRRYRYHSPVISAEWCAFTNVPWGRGLINFEPQEEALAMETYATWARLFELQRYYSWIVDR